MLHRAIMKSSRYTGSPQDKYILDRIVMDLDLDRVIGYLLEGSSPIGSRLLDLYIKNYAKGLILIQYFLVRYVGNSLSGNSVQILKPQTLVF